jgi:hypothetical protein
MISRSKYISREVLAQIFTAGTISLQQVRIGEVMRKSTLKFSKAYEFIKLMCMESRMILSV